MGAEELILASYRGDAEVISGECNLTNAALHAFAGLPYEGYTGEYGVIDSPEHRWCHAVLTNAPLPPLELPIEDGFGLTHVIFYSTDFGRQPLDDASARTRVLAAADSTTDRELLCEYAMCMKALGGSPTNAMLEAAENPVGEHHTILANIVGFL